MTIFKFVYNMSCLISVSNFCTPLMSAEIYESTIAPIENPVTSFFFDGQRFFSEQGELLGELDESALLSKAPAKLKVDITVNAIGSASTTTSCSLTGCTIVRKFLSSIATVVALWTGRTVP